MIVPRAEAGRWPGNARVLSSQLTRLAPGFEARLDHRAAPLERREGVGLGDAAGEEAVNRVARCDPPGRTAERLATLLRPSATGAERRSGSQGSQIAAYIPSPGFCERGRGEGSKRPGKDYLKVRGAFATLATLSD